MLWEVDLIHIEVKSNLHSGIVKELYEYLVEQEHNSPKGFSVNYAYCWESTYERTKYYLLTTTRRWLIDHGFEKTILRAADYTNHLFSLRMYPNNLRGEYVSKFGKETYAGGKEISYCVDLKNRLGI